MADNDLLPRLAGTVFGGLAGPLGIPTGMAVEALAPLVGRAVSDKISPPKIGTVLSYKGGQPFEIFAGPWGKQSLGSYLKLRARDPGAFPKPSGTLPDTLVESRPAPAAVSRPAVSSGSSEGGSTVTDPDWPAPPIRGGEPGTVGETSAGNVGEQMAKPSTEPMVDRLFGSLEQLLTNPVLRRQLGDESIRQFAAQTAITGALGAEKSAQRLRREKEIATIEQWGKAFQAQTAANALSNIAMGQAVIAFQQPNVNTVSALNQGATAAAQVLGVAAPRIS